MTSPKFDPDEYSSIVTQAEAAVQSVKDPELRRVAFEKILETLFGGGVAAVSKAKSPKKSGSKSSKGKSVSKTASNGSGPKSKLLELIEDGYFKEQRTLTDVKAELADRGFHIPVTSLSNPLMRLTRQKKLRRQKLSAGGKGAKTTYAYSNW